jgi:hypothetical protein
MSSVQTSLYNTYLISGQYDKEKGSVVEKTVVPVANGFFTRMNHKEQSLITTDDFGMLHSMGSGGNRLQRINDDNFGSLQLNIIPPGIPSQSYFAFDKEWQTKLMEKIRQMSLPAPFEPIPVDFTDKHLRPGHDADDDKLQAHFKGKTCKGQLIPRLHVLTVLIDKAVMASPPTTLTAHRGGEAIVLHGAASPVTLEIEGHHKAQFLVYSASGPNVKEGNYVISVPTKDVASTWHKGNSSHHSIQRTFQAGFGVHTLFGDFDFQILDLPSVEDAILAHFAERYPHLLVEESDSDKADGKPYAQAAGSLTRYWAATAVLNEARKTTVGFVNADTSSRTRTIVGAALGALRDSNTKGVSEEAGMASQILSKIYQSGEVLESWKKFVDGMHITRENAAALKLVEQVMDSGAIQKFFKENAWRKTVVKAIQDVEAKKGSLLGRYVLLRKEHADPVLLEKLMKNATSPKAWSFQASALAKVESKIFWALDTASTVKQMAETITALSGLRLDAEGNASALRKNMAEYGKRFGSAPCTEAVRRLEVLRKAADEAAAGVDEKAFEMVEQSAKLTLKALSLVPAVGEFAGLASMTIETLEALGSILDTGSDIVDRVMWRHRSTLKRFAELSELHALQCRAIAEAGAGKHDDPHTQFRLRLIILIGLLRLIERCGCRQSDPKAFDKKIKDYNIEGYLDSYVFSDKSFPIALSSGTPLDEIWVYGCGNKNTDWNDIAATLGSVSDSLVDLVRGTRTVFAPVAFQKYFPIHGRCSKSVKDLALAFSLNFAGVIDKMEFSCVYVREKKQDNWVAADKAKFNVEPGTAVRVVAVFKTSGDLTGCPMSLQIKRTDTSIDGPVYKTSLARTTQALDDHLDDKGLLPYTPEKQYIGDPSAFSCVFYPFYFFRDHMIQGIKPFGHIGLSGNITLDFSFNVKAGDDGKYASSGGLGDTVRMHMRTSDKLHTEMILNKSFLDHKASDADHGKMWNNPYGIQAFQVGSVHWRCGKGQWTYAADADGRRFKQTLTKENGFAWGASFELMVVFGSLYAERENWPQDPIRVPAQIVMKEKSDGPDFPVEVYSLFRNETFSVVTYEMVQRALLDSKLLTELDVSKHKFPPAGFASKDPMALWAVRVHFKYQVEGTDGQMIDKEGLRPFGKSYVNESGTYTYHFNLRSSDPLGLKIEDVLELTVPGVPASFSDGTALAGDTGWITDEYRRKSLKVEKAE